MSNFDPATLEVRCVCGHEIKDHARNRKQERTECLHCDPKTGKFCSCKKYKPEDKTMNGDTAVAVTEKSKKPKAKRVKAVKEKKAKAPKVAKVKKEKVSTVTQFEATAKESKELSAKDNDSQLAVIYRAVAESGPCTFDVLWGSIYRSFQGSKAPLEKQKINVRTYLSRLDKAGLVKRSKIAA
jgi:hypothetical protein